MSTYMRLHIRTHIGKSRLLSEGTHAETVRALQIMTKKQQNDDWRLISTFSIDVHKSMQSFKFLSNLRHLVLFKKFWSASIFPLLPQLKTCTVHTTPYRNYRTILSNCYLREECTCFFAIISTQQWCTYSDRFLMYYLVLFEYFCSIKITGEGLKAWDLGSIGSE